MTTEPDDDARFLRPRTVAGLLMFALVAVLALIDAMRPDYSLDTIQLGLMSGTGGVLLGVPIFAKLLR